MCFSEFERRRLWRTEAGRFRRHGCFRRFPQAPRPAWLASLPCAIEDGSWLAVLAEGALGGGGDKGGVMVTTVRGVTVRDVTVLAAGRLAMPALRMC